MMHWLTGGLFAVLISVGSAAAQPRQMVEDSAPTAVARPAWPIGTGPRLLIDEAHSNFHTAGGSYAPLAALLGNDGFRVAPSTAPISAQSLAAADILVIANARGAPPPAPAFAAAEIAALRTWVEGGGSLLLVADHSPFSDAAAELAQAFGIAFRPGFALNPGQQNRDVFRPGTGLADHAITRGAGGDPAVGAIRTFTGSAFEAPAAQPLITLGPGFILVAPGGQGGRIRLADLPQNSAEGLLQGAALSVGRGRVVVIGEAAMLTAQRLEGVPEAAALGEVGFAAEQNRQFLLNLMHWLSRRPGY